MADQPDQPDRKRQQRLDEVFGDVLPSSTQDDLPEGEERGSADEETDAAERWLRENRPPHHDPAENS